MVHRDSVRARQRRLVGEAVLDRADVRGAAGGDELARGDRLTRSAVGIGGLSPWAALKLRRFTVIG